MVIPMEVMATIQKSTGRTVCGGISAECGQVSQRDTWEGWVVQR